MTEAHAEPCSDKAERHPMMDIAWRDFISAAAEMPGMVEAFNRATGRCFGSRPQSPIDHLIDRAVGKDRADAHAFMLWVTEHHWGVDMAPEAVRAEIAAEKAKQEKPE